ncbi:MAG: DedA family protein [Rickettsiales bacterium]|nr:DedA family protein [Rickettsiales bacterium]
MEFSIEGIIQFFLWFVEEAGYFGIFLMTLIESTFVPIPAEVTMIPAGYLVHMGKLNGPLVLLSSVAGSVGGAYVNYWLAKHYGRLLFTKYGKLFMLTPQKLEKIERYFVDHGAISVFTGRLLPGIKHYISFPAGLAQMPMRPFLIYCTLSGVIWMTVLLGLGYAIGENEAMLKPYLIRLKEGLALFAIVLIIAYLIRRHITRKPKLP